tara:strand:- start:8 stop:205 length:198 start_codon:yes stop_codon:yes gene_type:complete
MVEVKQISLEVSCQILEKIIRELNEQGARREGKEGRERMSSKKGGESKKRKQIKRKKEESETEKN